MHPETTRSLRKDWDLIQQTSSRFIPFFEFEQRHHFDTLRETVQNIETASEELKRDGYKLLVSARKEPWGQIVTRLLSPEGILVGITINPRCEKRNSYLHHLNCFKHSLVYLPISNPISIIFSLSVDNLDQHAK